MAFSARHGELLDQIARHEPADGDEARMAALVREFVELAGEAFDARYPAGHVTGSAWVLNPSRSHVLLTLHRRIGKWFQLGGHVEPGETVREAAIREAREESGLGGVILAADGIFDIDVHWIPETKKKAAHWHYDVRYLCEAPAVEPTGGAESRAVAWVALDEVSALNPDASLARMVAKTRRLILSPAPRT